MNTPISHRTHEIVIRGLVAGTFAAIVLLTVLWLTGNSFAAGLFAAAAVVLGDDITREILS